VPRLTAVESIRQAVEMALAQAGLLGSQVDTLCISAPAEPGSVAEAMQQSGIRIFFRAAEGETPRWAARFWINEHIGVTVDAGTGSLARGWSRDGRLASAGGWGATLGDEGSGYWISLQAIRAVLQAQDGRIGPTRLTRVVLEHFQVSSVVDLVFRATQGLVVPEQQDVFRVVPDSGDEQKQEIEKKTGGYNFRDSSAHGCLTRDQIASLCPAVVRAAVHGDEKAIDILHSAGQELGQLATAVIRRLEMENDVFVVVPFGGVFRAGDWVLGSFTETIQSVAGCARVIRTRYEPVVGAVLLGLHDLGIDIDARLIDALERSTLSFPSCRMTCQDEL
jgi:N-acetylglucosamine kinase-like BadF-type ATPase